MQPGRQVIRSIGKQFDRQWYAPFMALHFAAHNTSANMSQFEHERSLSFRALLLFVFLRLFPGTGRRRLIGLVSDS